ncbi:DUF3846 domain-containing protein [Candidatus Allofournierella merdavium]|uniref:DUF3846 domain-containing protein n=1 Tax=Candidatus Allofournierella merdavium TaxID=2838593 RepID=UPI00374F55A2
MERITCADLMGYLEKEPEKVMVLDIETTGLHAPEDEVLSLTIIDGTGETLFYDSFKPEHNTAWPEAQAVNGISPDDVADGSIFTEETEYINLLLAKAAVIVGYNHEGFDLPFLAQFGVCPPEDVKLVDVMIDYAEIKGEWDKNHQDWKWQKLTACAAHYGYQYQAHDSLEDVKATLFCARKCAEDQLRQKAVYQIESGNILFIQACDGGYDYTIYDADNKAIDGGRLDNERLSLLDVRDELLMEFAPMESVYTYTEEAANGFLDEVAEAEGARPEQKKEMQVLIVRPGEYAKRATIDGTLESMQHLVGGMIEVVYPWEERAAIVCNDEALLLNMKPNRFVAEIQEPIFGSFFVCGLGDGDLVGLTDEQLERFEKKFHYPQLFTMAENCCIVTDCRPEDLTQPKEPLSP